MGAGEVVFGCGCIDYWNDYGGVVYMDKMMIEDAWIHVKCFKCDGDVIYEGEGNLVECKCKCKSRVLFKKDVEDQDRLALPQQTMIFNNSYKDVREWAEKGIQRGYWLMSDYYELKGLCYEE